MARKNNSNDVSSWVGWVYFAGFLLTLSGVFNAVAGLVGLFKNEVYVVGKANLWLLDYTTWGWAHLILGVFLLLAGAAIMSGKLWGRLVGIIFIGLSMIANFGFVPVYPVWAILLISINVFTLYALIVHGDEANDMLE